MFLPAVTAAGEEPRRPSLVFAGTRSGRRPPPAAAGWTAAVVVCAAVAAGLLTVRTRPSFDAFGWLVWGYQTTHGHLDLGGAPSWKPLPFLFTVPYSLLGVSAELWLWRFTAATVALVGIPVGGWIAFRLARRRSGASPLAACAGALFAAAAVAGLQDYAHYILSSQSDPMIVTWVLVAVAVHLGGRPRLALATLFLASLGRPEAWPFLGLYGLWGWRRVEGIRVLVAAAFLLVAFLWFGVPWITNGKPFVAGTLALNSPRELHHNRVGGTITRFLGLETAPVWVAALLAAALAVLRRERVILVLGAACLLWVAVEVAFALHGWPALPRYLFEPAAVAACLAGWGLARLYGEAQGFGAGAAGRVRRLTTPAAAAAAVVAAGFTAWLIPGLVQRANAERADLVHEHHRTLQIDLLERVLGLGGGYAYVDFCGKPVVQVEYTSALAFLTHLNVGFLGHKPVHELHLHHPIVLFTPLRQGGWSLLPWHTRPARIRGCRALHFKLALTGSHPEGVLVRRAGSGSRSRPHI